MLEKTEKISIKYDQERIRCFGSIIIEAGLALKYSLPTQSWRLIDGWIAWYGWLAKAYISTHHIILFLQVENLTGVQYDSVCDLKGFKGHFLFQFDFNIGLERKILFKKTRWYILEAYVALDHLCFYLLQVKRTLIRWPKTAITFALASYSLMCFYVVAMAAASRKNHQRQQMECSLMIVSAAPPPPLTAVEASIAAAAAAVMELLKRINLYFILYYSLYPN